MKRIDEETCQAALDAKHPTPLEGSGFRIYREGDYLVVQDLLEGNWFGFGTYTLRATENRPTKCSGIKGKRAAIESCQVIASLVGGWLERLCQDVPVPTGGLAAALLAGGEEHPHGASLLIPMVGAVRKIAYPFTWDVPDAEVVSGIVKVSTALALLGGRAAVRDIMDDLRSRGHGTDEAATMLDLACRKGNIRRVRGFPHDEFVIERPRPFDPNEQPKREGTKGPRLADLFASDDD